MFSSSGVLVRAGILVRNRTFSSNLNSRHKRKFKMKGVVFLTMSILVFITGTILTVLGFVSDFFGPGWLMLGMLMIAVSMFQFMCAIRQFLMFRKISQEDREPPHTGIPTAAMVIERDHDHDTLTVVMDTVTCEARAHSRSHSRQSFCNDSLPPCYMEATSDYYTESPVEIVIDSMVEPPPPYGPPTYDEAVSQAADAMVVNEDQIGEPVTQQEEEVDGHVTGSETWTNENEVRQTVPPIESQTPVVYQDFTNVTI